MAVDMGGNLMCWLVERFLIELSPYIDGSSCCRMTWRFLLGTSISGFMWEVDFRVKRGQKEGARSTQFFLFI